MYIYTHVLKVHFQVYDLQYFHANLGVGCYDRIWKGKFSAILLGLALSGRIRQILGVSRPFLVPHVHPSYLGNGGNHRLLWP